MHSSRQQRRFIKRFQVEFSANDVMYRGVSGDLSLKGLFIKTDFPFPPDTILTIVVHLSDGLTSRLKAKVKREAGDTGKPIAAARHGMGVEIVERDTTYRSLIASLLA